MKTTTTTTAAMQRMTLGEFLSNCNVDPTWDRAEDQPFGSARDLQEAETVFVHVQALQVEAYRDNGDGTLDRVAVVQM